MKNSLVGLFLFVLAALYAQPFDAGLILLPEDCLVEEGGDGGYHIWVRQKGRIRSVLLADTTRDPAKKYPTYALRDPNYNPINGDEKRILDGVFLAENKGIVDSTAEIHPVLGAAFQLFVPYTVVYGYPWSRQGEISITDGTFVNILTFSQPYADWTGDVQDNPFRIKISFEREQRVEPTGKYLDETVNEFTEIAAQTAGTPLKLPQSDILVDELVKLLRNSEKKDSLDLVLVLDTTLSMKEEMPIVQKELVAKIKPILAEYKTFRIGLVFFKDYYEEYLTKVYPFSPDLTVFQVELDRAIPRGGRDIPEAVYEALDTALSAFAWVNQQKIIILVGDAPPHPRPRGKITKEGVFQKARDLGVTVHTIIIAI